MKTTIKNIIKPLCFAIITLIIFLNVQEIFRYEDSFNHVKSFYDEPKDSLDVVFIGPSTTYLSIYPMELWNDYGIASYDFTSPGQTFPTSYYALREVVTQQTPKLIVIDTHCCAAHNNLTSHQHFFLDKLRFSPLKAECIQTLLADESKIEYYIPFLEFHSRWSELTREDFLPKNNYGKGSYPKYNVVPAAPNNATEVDELAPLGDISQEYLIKTLEFCKENNLNVLFTAPANNNPSGTVQKKFLEIERIVGEYGYDFINLRDYNDEIGLDLKTDYLDDIHTNSYGALKTTAFFGKYLKENYDLPDRRNDPEYSSWFDDYNTYQLWNNNEKLPTLTGISDYLESLDFEDYTVVISVRYDAVQYTNNKILNQLRALGLNPPEAGDECASYIAAISSGKVLYENKSAETELNMDIMVKDVHFTATSAGKSLGNSSSIKVNGKEYGMNRVGYNIVVYDNWSGSVVDSVSFNMTKENAPCSRIPA